MRLAPSLCLLVLGCASVPAPGGAAMKLGVNTHFDQGWPLTYFDQVAGARAQGIRDVLSWGKIEKTPGSYEFTKANSGFAERACATGVPLLVTVVPQNKLYEGGMTIVSATGRAAFASYVAALADQFPCIVGFEVGNEINGHSLKGPILKTVHQSYVAILAPVRAALKARHPRIALLGGSTQSVATGFHERLFAAGMLPLVDGVVVHPYRNAPEQLPLEFGRLRAAMQRHGGVKPIWASEFGLAYQSPDDAPPHALKVITVMSAAEIARADWYALIDEKYYPNMGLYKAKMPKPALDTFRLATERLLPAGEARRIDASDPLTYIYRYGGGAYVMWGGGRAIRFTAQVPAYDARGRAIALPTRLGPDPVVIDGAANFTLGPPTVLADTWLDYGTGPWSLGVRSPNGRLTPVRWVDWKWTSYVGLPGSNFRAMVGAVMVGGNAAKPTALVERYTSIAGGRVGLVACFEPVGAAMVKVRISHGGRELYAGAINGDVRLPAMEATLVAGDAIDIAYTSLGTGGPNVLHRRVRIVPAGQPAQALCAPGREADEQPGTVE